MPRTLKNGFGVSDNALSWIVVALGLTAAFILDKPSAPHKWHAAIVWTTGALFGLLVWCRKKWNSFPFWLFWLTCLVFHVFAMWMIFERLLPGLILGTLYVMPIAFIESVLLAVGFGWLAGKVSPNSNGAQHARQ
jgi:hypothetical protein